MYAFIDLRICGGSGPPNYVFSTATLGAAAVSNYIHDSFPPKSRKNPFSISDKRRQVPGGGSQFDDRCHPFQAPNDSPSAGSPSAGIGSPRLPQRCVGRDKPRRAALCNASYPQAREFAGLGLNQPRRAALCNNSGSTTTSPSYWSQSAPKGCTLQQRAGSPLSSRSAGLNQPRRAALCNGTS